MARNNVKILPRRANCNLSPVDPPTTAEKSAQARLAIALAKPNLIRGGLTHISEPLRKILARAASKLGGGE